MALSAGIYHSDHARVVPAKFDGQGSKGGAPTIFSTPYPAPCPTHTTARTSPRRARPLQPPSHKREILHVYVNWRLEFGEKRIRLALTKGTPPNVCLLPPKTSQWISQAI